MITATIFGATMLALIFFLVSTFFKLLDSMLQGGMTAIVLTLIGLLYSGGAFFILVVLHGIIYSISKGMSANGWIMLILSTILVGGIATFAGSLGIIVLDIAFSVATVAIGWSSKVFSFLSNLCDRGCNYFLNILIRQLDRC